MLPYKNADTCDKTSERHDTFDEYKTFYCRRLIGAITDITKNRNCKRAEGISSCAVCVQGGDSFSRHFFPRAFARDQGQECNDQHL